jgi:hypothetical protein
MRCMRARPAFAALTTVLLSVAISSAAAAAPTFKAKQEARALTAEAKKALKAGLADQAITALRRADELDPTPQSKLDLAAALIEGKKLLEAKKILGDVATLRGATFAEKKAAEAAKRSLAELEPRVPGVTITVEGPAASKASATIDGQSAALGAESPVDPGDHDVAVTADGFTSFERRLSVAEGAHEKLVASLAPAAKAEGGDGEGGSLVPAVIAFGVGAAGLAVGGVFGMLSLAETGDVKDQCDTSGTCPKDQADELDSAKTKGNISTIGFAVGGAGLVAGVVLLVVGGSKAEASTSRHAPVEPWIGLGQAGVSGTF